MDISSQVYPSKAYMHLSSPTCPANLNLPDLITRLICGEYKSWSLLLRNLLQPQIRSSAPNSHKYPQPMFLPACDRPSFTLMQNNRKNYSSVYFNLCVCGHQRGNKNLDRTAAGNSPSSIRSQGLSELYSITPTDIKGQAEVSNCLR